MASGGFYSLEGYSLDRIKMIKWIWLTYDNDKPYFLNLTEIETDKPYIDEIVHYINLYFLENCFFFPFMEKSPSLFALTLPFLQSLSLRPCACILTGMIEQTGGYNFSKKGKRKKLHLFKSGAQF